LCKFCITEGGVNGLHYQDDGFIFFIILKDLNQLTTLNLCSNQINDYSFLIDLKQLTSLDFSWNEISDISSLEELNKLITLNLEDNRIQNFNLDLNLLPNLEELSLYGNPIQNIPKEVLDKGIEAIRAYQKSTKR
jgi:Leucine-rich repeat (LRR) protein